MNLIYVVFSDIPTVAETKSNFLKAYKRPIPSIYNTVLQELIVQQHLMRYKKTYCYDAVFALGFVTVYDQLMEGYPSDEDRNAIFQAYIKALQEDPDQYRPAYNFLKTFSPSHLIFHYEFDIIFQLCSGTYKYLISRLEETKKHDFLLIL